MELRYVYTKLNVAGTVHIIRIRRKDDIITRGKAKPFSTVCPRSLVTSDLYYFSGHQEIKRINSQVVKFFFIQGHLLDRLYK